jgi:hypothetical protein
VKKALTPPSQAASAAREGRARSRKRTACRQKAPRVGERRLSSRKAGAARPSRDVRRASAPSEGGISLLPTSLRTGKRQVSATRGARSDRGRGEVSAASNRGGERRGSVSSTPDPAHLRRLPRIPRGDSRPGPAAVPATLPGGSGCSSRPRSCSWEHPLAEVARAHAAWKAPAKQRASKGLVGAFEPVDEHVRRRLRRPAEHDAPRRPPKGSLYGLQRRKAPRAREGRPH